MDLFLEKLSDPQFIQNTQFLFNLKSHGIKLGLDNITGFLEQVGNPHKGKRFIHIAGTNGKGSTLAILESVLIESGRKIGAFTSPHLITYQERFRINHQLISIDAVNYFIEKNRDQIIKYKLTFFEASTALAFWYFAQHETDYILLETGLGGRLDATNVVHAPIVAITRIGKDHTQFLGDTEESIAFEKAGIIHTTASVYLAENRQNVMNVIESRCKEQGAVLHYAPHLWKNTGVDYDRKKHLMEMTFNEAKSGKSITFSSPLLGFHQVENHQLALSVLSGEHLIDWDCDFLNKAMKKILWPGRLQLIRKSPLTFLDVGHNPDGFMSTLRTLKKFYPGKKLNIITGIVRDKDSRTIASILVNFADTITLVDFESERVLPRDKFYTSFDDQTIVSISDKNVYETFCEIESKIDSDEVILIIGSHYLIGEFFLHELKNKKMIDYFYKIP